MKKIFSDIESSNIGEFLSEFNLCSKIIVEPAIKNSGLSTAVNKIVNFIYFNFKKEVNIIYNNSPERVFLEVKNTKKGEIKILVLPIDSFISEKIKNSNIFVSKIDLVSKDIIFETLYIFLKILHARFNSKILFLGYYSDPAFLFDLNSFKKNKVKTKSLNLKKIKDFVNKKENFKSIDKEIFRKFGFFYDSLRRNEKLDLNLVKRSRMKKISFGCGIKISDINIILKSLDLLFYYDKN